MWWVYVSRQRVFVCMVTTMKRAGRMLAKRRCLLICSSGQLLMWPSQPLFCTIWSFQLQGTVFFFTHKLCATSCVSTHTAIHSQEILHLFYLMNYPLAWCFCCWLMAACLQCPCCFINTVRALDLTSLLQNSMGLNTSEHCFHAGETSLAWLYGMHCKTNSTSHGLMSLQQSEEAPQSSPDTNWSA